MNYPEDYLWRRGLNALRKYTYFFALLAYILGGLLVLFSLAVIFGLSFTSDLSLGGAQFLVGFLYLGISALYLVPAGYLYKASQALKRAETAESLEELLQSIPWLGRFFRFYGILAIILLVFYAIMLLFILAGVGLGASGIIG